MLRAVRRLPPAPVVAVLAAALLGACAPLSQRIDLYLAGDPGRGPPGTGASPALDPSPDAFRDAVRACDEDAGPLGAGLFAARDFRNALADCMLARGYRVLSSSGVRWVTTRPGPDGAVPTLATFVVLASPAADAACWYDARRRLITSRMTNSEKDAQRDALVADCQRAKAKGELVWEVVRR